jgi:HD-GYP domain-containing protein (c-di-GMP phosphodiesterase class II)
VTESGEGFIPHPSYRGVVTPGWNRIYSFHEGVTGHVLRSGESVTLRDVDDFSKYIIFNPSSRSELCVPMKIGDRVIGALNAESSKPNHYTADDERLLLTIAGQLANAIERLRTARAEREQRVLAEALRDTAETLNGTLDFNDVLDNILGNIGRVVPSETAMIMLLDGNIARAIRHRGFTERGDQAWIEALRINCDELADFHRAIETREPQLVADTRECPDWVEFEPSSWIRSHLLAPILIDQTVIGFIALDHYHPGFFSERDKGRLLAFSNQAATALENARLFESERQRRKEAETLREAATVVATTLNSNQAVNLILDQLSRVLQYDSASVQLLRDGFLEIVGGRGWANEAAVLGMQFPVPGDNPNSVVVLEQRPVIIESTRKTEYSFLQSPHNHILSWLGVPLVARGEVIGMLAVDSKEERHFNEEHTRLVSAFANQAAIAIENARLYEQNEGQIRRLTSLRDIDTAIASSLDLRVTLNILLDQAMAQLQPDAMDILIYNPHLQNLETLATAGFHAPPVRRQSRIGDGLGGTIATTRRMLQVPNLTARAEFASARWITDERFIYYTGVPLLGKGQIKGVLEAFFRSEKNPNADWLDFLQTIAGQAAIAIDNAQLFENLQRSNQELSLAYDTTLEGWGKALELRDKETEGHTRRVADLTIQLARRMGINETEITHIRRGVLLHDIGKMGVPDHILRKGGSLTDDEWREMRLHPQYAYDLLYPISYLRPSLDIPFCHHERWDGGGYPRGLKGTEIPLSARIFTVVDVWDALLSDRPYRGAWTREQTIDYIEKEAGKRFDPRVVQIFLGMISQE